MTELNQKTDIGELGQHWHERLKELRLARTSQANGRLRQAPQADSSVPNPTDADLFVGTVHEELTSADIFAGDDSTFRALENASNVVPKFAQPPKNLQTPRTAPISFSYNNFSFLEISLAAGVLVVAGVLIFQIVRPFAFRSSAPQQSQEVRQAVDTVQRPAVKTQQPAKTVQAAKSAEPAVEVIEPQVHTVAAVQTQQPATLKTAQQLYLNENYYQAMEVYSTLYGNFAAGKDDLMKDFLQMQLALCSERLGQYTQAAMDFRRLLYSRSPVIRVMASYHCGLLELHRSEYLNARTRAYQAIAMIDVVDYDADWAHSFRRNCYFLAAQAMTKEVLKLCEPYGKEPAELWPVYSAADEIFLNISENQVYDLLNSGISKLLPASLGPQIQRFDNQGGFNLYNIVCDGASIEELIGKFSFATQIDAQWNANLQESGLRRQLVYLYLRSAQVRQFAVVAAGCAGLLADTDEDGTIKIYNPTSYSLLSEHLANLSDQAVSQWREFLLMFPEDQRLTNARFALGLLYIPQNLYTESISEYRLIVNRFSRSPLAPYALLNLASIRQNLKDYRGAYEDLRQLAEQFPDSQVAVDSVLQYAQAAFKAELKEQSAGIYKKAYHSALTKDVQTAAAFGAGRCLYMSGNYQEAEKWLTTYITSAPNTPSTQLYQAYLYLAKTYLALEKTELASGAMNIAMQGAPMYLKKEEYIDVIPALVEAYMKQGSYVQAMNLVTGVDAATLTQEESVRMLILKSKLFRAMGLVDKALVVFGDRVEYTYDKQLRAEIYFELSGSYIEKGDYNTAGKLLGEVIVLAKPGTMMYQASLNLADVCLRQGNASHAIAVCRRLLELEPQADVKQKALELLAEAYKQNKNYDSAALALMGQWK